MNNRNAVRVSCPTCGMQVEVVGRRTRCPVCGSRVESKNDDYQPLPPLPAALQARAAGDRPMVYGRQTRWGLVAASLLFLLVGIVAAVNGITLGAPLLTVSGAILLSAVAVSFVVSKGWQVTDLDGARRYLADLPIYLGVILALAVSVATLAAIVYGVFQLHVLAGTVLILIILVCCVGGVAHWGSNFDRRRGDARADGYLLHLAATYSRALSRGRGR